MNKKVCELVVPEGCKFVQKKDMVVITLKKEKSSHWNQLNYKDKPKTEDVKGQNKDDP